MVILLPSAESFKKGCCQLQAKVWHEVLVNCLFKLAQEKEWLGELTPPPMTIAVDLGRKATKQTNNEKTSVLFKAKTTCSPSHSSTEEKN